MQPLIHLILLCAALVGAATAPAQKWEGVADTPPMGWNSWNKFGCNIDERMIREMADAMVDSGLAEAGYVYINLDDCWHAPERDADGFPQCDTTRFPSGMKALADYVHAKGLKLGIYSDAGWTTCAGRFGSLGHEYQDALQYARWGIDYLKYDWCNTADINPKGAYTLMREALRAAGRPILFSICEWGSNKPWEWAPEIGHMWRTTGDIGLSFSDPEVFTGAWKPRTVLQNVDTNAPLRRYAGPGHWNDPDMLEVGNGMTVNQDRAHFTLWCMMAAPLILGNDLRTMTDETAAILTDREVIAIDQDPLGVQGLRYATDNGIEIWFKPLVDGEWAFCLFNRTHEERTYEIDWQLYCFTDTEVSQRSTAFDRIVYEGRDLWNGGKSFRTDRPRSVVIPAEDVVLYRLKPVAER